MKKILVLAAFAFLLASCGGGKEEGICVCKFYGNPIENLGKEITITGHAKMCCSGSLVITDCNGSKVIRVMPNEGVVVPENLKDAMIKVKGIISEEIIDQEYVIALRVKADAEQDSTAKAAQLAKADKIEEIIVDGVIHNYTIDASAIEITKGCSNKDCKGGECAKKCEGNHEGCDKKCEGENHEGCEKKCEGEKKAE